MYVCVCVCGSIELASGANVRQSLEGFGSVLLGLKHSGLVGFTHDIFLPQNLGTIPFMKLL